jgi:D-3-phosphoglycerate dehydrogenase
MVDAELLGHLPDGAWVINTSRGGIVDEQALLTALDDKQLRAGIDVWPDEPDAKQAAWDSPLARHPRVYGTHHIGASTDQAQRAIAAEVVAMLTAYEAGEVRSSVNVETRPLGTATLVVRHLDQVGVLSDVLAVLKRCELNVEQMDNTVLAGAEAAVATIRTAGTVPDGLVDQLLAIDEVLGVRLASGER